MSKANGSEALVAEQLSKDRAVIELCRRSLVNHFVVRDMDAALAYMADDVEWLGPFSCQTASDKKTMEDILRPEYSIRLALADERWRARKRANTWIVSARYTLLVVSAGGERSMPFKQHATYVWPLRRTDLPSCICTCRTPPMRTPSCLRSILAKTPSNSCTSTSMPRDPAPASSASETRTETFTFCIPTNCTL